MRRVHAWRVVAGVADQYPWLDGAVSEHPRKPMGADLLAFDSHPAVAVLIDITNPFHASAGANLDVLPEALCGCSAGEFPTGARLRVVLGAQFSPDWAGGGASLDRTCSGTIHGSPPINDS